MYPRLISKIAEDFVVEDFVKPAVLQRIDPNQFGTIPKSSPTYALSKAECSQTRACALHSQTWKNLCCKSNLKKTKWRRYGSGVNFNTGYIMMDLFNFGVKSTRLNVIFTGCSKFDTWFAWSAIWYLVQTMTQRHKVSNWIFDTMRHYGWELCALSTFVCFLSKFPYGKGR